MSSRLSCTAMRRARSKDRLLPSRWENTRDMTNVVGSRLQSDSFKTSGGPIRRGIPSQAKPRSGGTGTYMCSYGCAGIQTKRTTIKTIWKIRSIMQGFLSSLASYASFVTTLRTGIDRTETDAVIFHVIICTCIFCPHLPAALATFSLFLRRHSLPLAFSTSGVT
jgi:hypothetical protein